MSAFTKATKKQARAKIALEGPAGFGKTLTALKVGRALVGPTGKIAFIDTEAGSAEKYAPVEGEAANNIDTFEFDTIALEPPFHPDRFVELILDAEANEYDLVIPDSLSHAWTGKGGLLEIVDEIARTKYRGDSHRAWKDAGEIQQRLVDAVLRSRIHVIACMRTKTDYVRDEVAKQGGGTRTVIRKQGVKVVQRDEFDYEFDIVGRFEQPTILTITKSRCFELPPTSSATDATDRRSIIEKPGEELAATLAAWLGSGAKIDEPKPTKAQVKRMSDVLGKLAEADSSRDWTDAAEKYVRREFSHGLGALTKGELEKAVKQFEQHLEKLTAAKTNGAGDPAEAQATLA